MQNVFSVLGEGIQQLYSVVQILVNLVLLQKSEQKNANKHYFYVDT